MYINFNIDFYAHLFCDCDIIVFLDFNPAPYIIIIVILLLLLLHYYYCCFYVMVNKDYKSIRDGFCCFSLFSLCCV